MEKEFIPYVRALRMKAIGFDEPCLATYLGYPETRFCLYSKEDIELGHTKNSNRWISLPECCSAPTFSQAFRWFREKYNLIAEFNWHSPSKCYATSIFPSSFYIQTKTYEEAELACLDKLLEIVESKSK